MMMVEKENKIHPSDDFEEYDVIQKLGRSSPRAMFSLSEHKMHIFSFINFRFFLGLP
jgi:hypothetical protein